MSRGIQQQPAKFSKKRKKDLRSPNGRLVLQTLELPEKPTPREMPKRGFHKVSKRTTPGRVSVESAPGHIHKEGVRWVKTLVQQALIKKKIFQRKFLKQRR